MIHALAGTHKYYALTHQQCSLTVEIIERVKVLSFTLNAVYKFYGSLEYLHSTCKLLAHNYYSLILNISFGI